MAAAVIITADTMAAAIITAAVLMGAVGMEAALTGMEAALTRMEGVVTGDDCPPPRRIVAPRNVS